ncbi:MAG: GtrA family protein [Pseudomonadota bacterium]
MLIKRATRFAGASLISATLNLSLPVILHEIFGIEKNPSVACTLVFTFFFNFWITRNYVYQNRNGVRRQFTLFLIADVGFRLAEYHAYLFVSRHLDAYFVISLFLVLCASLVLKFLIQNYVIFAIKHDQQLGHNTPDSNLGQKRDASDNS